MIPTRIRFEVLERDEFSCQYCGAKAPTATLQVDHIIPRSAGGSDLVENLITACRDCNMGKADSPLRFVPDHILDRAGTAYERGAAMREAILQSSPERLIPAEPTPCPAAVLDAIESPGQAIAVSIAAARVTQAYVAGAIGVSTSYLCTMISGTRRVTERHIEPICAATGSTLLRDYFSREAEKASQSEVERLAALLRETAP